MVDRLHNMREDSVAATGRKKVQPAEGAALWMQIRRGFDVAEELYSPISDYDFGPHWPCSPDWLLAAEARGIKTGCEVKPR